MNGHFLEAVYSVLLIGTGAVWIVAVSALTLGMRRLQSSKTGECPTAAVLVAARNEEVVIGRCVEALRSQDYPADHLEIVILDDDSTDRTAKIVAKTIAGFPRIRLLPAGTVRRGMSPKKSALLTGIAATTGEIILTTDADCVPPPGWVAGMVALFVPDVVAVAGFSPVTSRTGNFDLARFDALINGIVSAGLIGIGRPGTVAGRNFAYRRSAFDAVGGFGDSGAGASGDDDLLLQRLSGSGGRVVFASNPATFVPATGPESFYRWWRMKRRHLSAGARYSPALLLPAAALHLFNTGILAGLLGAAFGYLGWMIPVAALIIRMIADYYALEQGARLLGERGWRMAWFLSELALLPLLTLLGPLSLVGRIDWKGRQLKR
ncbi:MAG: glycosyltransferase [Calditrichaeota bacterium]|nr:glycosyltransferase [Calditrichota bacterium]